MRTLLRVHRVCFFFALFAASAIAVLLGTVLWFSGRRELFQGLYLDDRIQAR